MAELVRQLVANELHPVLRPLGFARNGSTWNRRSGEFVQVINVQSSQGSMRANEKCTVNLGIFWEKAYTILWQKPPSKFIREPECILRRRIGKLLDEKSDRWWVLRRPGDVKAVGEVLIRLLTSRGLPWLDRFTSLRELHDALAAEEVVRRISLAIVKAEMGDKRGAAALLDEGAGQPWQEQSRTIRERLHLESVA